MRAPGPQSVASGAVRDVSKRQQSAGNRVSHLEAVDLKDCAFQLAFYDSFWEWSLPPIAARLMTPAALC